MGLRKHCSDMERGQIEVQKGLSMSLSEISRRVKHFRDVVNRF